VKCSAVGTNVVSTFLHVNMPLEEQVGDGEPREDLRAHDFAQNSWALWNGTSFAGPKVAAAIASRLGDPATPRTCAEAWENLLATRGEEHPELELGRIFR
jgi:hypothetical protein